MRHQRSQAVKIRPTGTNRVPVRLQHLLLLGCLALMTTATTVRAADVPIRGWSAELFAAHTLGPEGRPIVEYPGELRLPTRDSQLVAGLAVVSATSGLRPRSDQGTPFYQIVLAEGSGPDQPIQALLYGGIGARLFPSFGGGPTRPDGCEAAATYCSEDLYAAGAPTTETFYDLTSSRGERAEAVHSSWRDRESWTVLLYNPGADVTYGLTLHDAAARHIGATGLTPANRELARSLVELAAGFEPLSPTLDQLDRA